MTDVKDIIPPDAKAAADKAATDAAAASAEATAKAKADADAADATAKAQAAAAIAQGGKVGDILAGKSKEERQVPESVFLEIKKENEAVWTELKKVQDMIAAGAGKPKVSETLQKIGDKYKVSADFLGEVASAIRAEADADIDAKVSERMKTAPKKEGDEPSAASEAERIDKIFSEHYSKTLEAMPEYKDVANKDAIKQLTLLPENRDKTFAQILEAAYGHLVEKQGKRTIEAATPGGDRAPAPIDYDKAAKDGEYFKTIMADPALRKEYNANIHIRLRL